MGNEADKLTWRKAEPMRLEREVRAIAAWLASREEGSALIYLRPVK